MRRLLGIGFVVFFSSCLSVWSFPLFLSCLSVWSFPHILVLFSFAILISKTVLLQYQHINIALALTQCCISIVLVVLLLQHCITIISKLNEICVSITLVCTNSLANIFILNRIKQAFKTESLFSLVISKEIVDGCISLSLDALRNTLIWNWVVILQF